jgi:hypothetical protein
MGRRHARLPGRDCEPLYSHLGVVTKNQIVCRCSTAKQTANKVLIEKIVFSEDPATEGCILAAMTDGHPLTTRFIALCRLNGPRRGWTTQGCAMHPCPFEEIAFCHGELYGLLSGCQLYKFGIGLNKDNAQVLISLVKLSIQAPDSFYSRYIFELRGKLATMAEVIPEDSSKARIFRVFELANNNTSEPYKYSWAEVSSLGDHALFLGQGCCKAVRVSMTTMRGEVEQNCIYYYKQEFYPIDGTDPEFLDSLDLGSCDVCCFKNDGLHYLQRIRSRGYHYREKSDGICRRIKCTWILPPQF